MLYFPVHKFIHGNPSYYQGGRGHWTVNYTGTQSFISTLSYSLAKILSVIMFNFDRLVLNLYCPKLFNQQFESAEGIYLFNILRKVF